MTKADFIDKVAMRANISRREANEVFSTITDVITEALIAGDSLTFVGFGKFETRQRKAKTARNPQTGAELTIPAKRVPAFKPGKALKEAVK